MDQASLQAVRKSTLGAKIGKKLFTKGALSLSPSDISVLLMSLGLTENKTTTIGLDIAQAIFSGGAFNDVKNLAEALGILKLSKDQSQELTVAGDTLMVIAGGGLNVLADLKMIIDVVSVISAWQGQAQREAQAGLSGVLRQRYAGETKSAHEIFNYYQKGQLSIFQTMAWMAQSAPDYFLTFFPQLNGFVPTYALNFSYHQSDTSWWGDHNSYDANAAIQTIQNDLRTIQTAIFAKYVGTPLTGFNTVFVAGQNNASWAYEDRSLVNPSQLDNLRKYGFPKGSGLPVHNFPLPRIRLDDLAALSMLPPNIQVFPVGFDIGRLLEFLNLTPYDLEDPLVDIAIQNPELFPDAPKMNLTPQFTMNGVDYYSPDQQKTYNGKVARAKIDSQLQKNLQNWDTDGNIRAIRSTSKGKYMLKEWGTLPVASAEQVGVENWWTKFGMTYDPTKAIDISQYWSALGFLEKMRNDTVFTSNAAMALTGQDFQDVFGKYNWTGQLASIEAKHKRLWGKVVTRKLNLLGLNNIAHFLNKPVSQLKKFETHSGQVYYE